MRPLFHLPSVFTEHVLTAEAESALMLEPVVALVTNNADPQKLNRVCVKYPDLSDKDESYWAPILMSGAGKNRGWFFLPEVNDEVLVMFEYGEMNKPVVVGALWNGKDKPPDNNKDKKNDRRVIKSRQKSKITFDDSGEPKIIIEDGEGVGRITIDSKANKITIEAMKGDVCFQAPTGNMQIVCDGLELKGGTSVEVHAGAPMNLGADDVKVKGSSTTINGAMAQSNCGVAQAPQAPTGDVSDIADKYGS